MGSHFTYLPLPLCHVGIIIILNLAEQMWASGKVQRHLPAFLPPSFLPSCHQARWYWFQVYYDTTLHFICHTVLY